MSSSWHGRSNAMSRAANHMSLWPASSSHPASSRPWASKSPPPEVVDRRPADVFDEVPLQVLGLQEADVGAVPLDGADPGQRRHERLGIHRPG
jgi:hypothetical protein